MLPLIMNARNRGATLGHLFKQIEVICFNSFAAIHCFSLEALLLFKEL